VVIRSVVIIKYPHTRLNKYIRRDCRYERLIPCFVFEAGRLRFVLGEISLETFISWLAHYGHESLDKKWFTMKLLAVVPV
jgi:hypothetical protein